MNGRIIKADCIEAMKDMDEDTVEAVVSDPPYGLAFMGNDWDDFDSKEYQEFCEEWGEQALRVLKPGGHLLAFSGSRTYHRMVVGLEDAGFVIRDMIEWMYGSGFPKGQDISKAIDKHKGVEREVRDVEKKTNPATHERYGDYGDDGIVTRTSPGSDAAERWDGWGTALKPSHEPVVVAQVPREGTYAENTLKYGVGGLNIDACRIDVDGKKLSATNTSSFDMNDYEKGTGREYSKKGRWPTNAVFDEEAGRMLDEQSGKSKSQGGNSTNVGSNISFQTDYSNSDKYAEKCGFGDEGGASRFFYSAKAHKSERNAGLQELEERKLNQGYPQDSQKRKDRQDKDQDIGLNKTKEVKNDIATLKPINLMRWLIRLVTPEDGTVLDPFAGSGTTGCAAEVERRDYILIEKRERFAEVIAPRRCEYWSNPDNWEDLKEHEEVPCAEEKRNNDLQKFMEAEK